MNNEITKIRFEAIKNASGAIRGLHGSLELGERILEIQEAFALNQERHIALARAIGDVILGIMPENEFVTHLQKDAGLSENGAIKTKEIIQPFFDQANKVRIIVDADSSLEIEEVLKPKEKLDLRPAGVTPASQITADEAGAPATPLSREEVLRALSAKRTMGGDIEKLEIKE